MITGQRLGGGTVVVQANGGAGGTGLGGSDGSAGSAGLAYDIDHGS